jgi:hypothetical protein
LKQNEQQCVMNGQQNDQHPKLKEKYLSNVWNC